MAYDQYLPTLSSEGWLTNKEAIIEKLFIYFLAGDVYQSNTFKDYVYTLKEAIQRSDDNHPLQDLISEYLTRLYEDFFPVVEPTITIQETDTDLLYTIDLKLVDEDKKEYNIQRILQSRDSKIINWQELLFSYKALKI